MINIALIQPRVILEWEKGNKERIYGLVNKNSELNRFKIVNNEEDADLIVLLDSCTFKTQKDIKYFESLLHFNEDNKRLFTINYEDGPPGFLPGLYSSLEQFKFDPAIHISWPHLVLPNEQIQKVRPNKEINAEMLFTFSGSCSNPVRRKIFNIYNDNSTLYKVREVRKWYDHNESEKKSYIDDIMDSKFVLCPKGIASYSHRIIETLALGKVPVIIADDWVPFSIPEEDYFVSIKEKDVRDIIEILQKKESEYEKLRTNAVRVYNKYFDSQFCYSVALNQLADLYSNRFSNTTSKFLKSRWKSREFWKNNKWCIEDRIFRKINKMIKSFSS